MQSETTITAIAYVIELAVAPVFLLAGVDGILGVLTNRLARIVERARVLEDRLPGNGEEEREQLHQALCVLSRRARLINWAISLCTTCALLVCVVIVVLFVEVFLSIHLRAIIAILFIAAMLALITGLLTFLHEVYLATASLRIGPPKSDCS